MRVGLVVNPAMRGFLANSSIGARAAPSAKIFSLSRLGSDGVMKVLSRHLGYRSFSERPVEKGSENVRVARQCYSCLFSTSPRRRPPVAFFDSTSTAPLDLAPSPEHR